MTTMALAVILRVRRPSGFVEPCLPSRVARPPTGLLWLHEIKHNFGAFSAQTSYFRHGDTASVTLMETQSKE